MIADLATYAFWTAILFWTMVVLLNMVVYRPSATPRKTKASMRAMKIEDFLVKNKPKPGTYRARDRHKFKREDVT